MSTCPICESELRGNESTLDGWYLEEAILTCHRCGYTDHYAYGAYQVTVGRHKFCWYWYTPSDRIHRINQLISRAANLERKRRKLAPIPHLPEPGQKIYDEIPF